MLRVIAIFPSPTTSPAHELEKTLHDAAYQLKLITLVFLRGMNEQDEFRLDVETKDTGKFDDLIYGWKNIGDGKVTHFSCCRMDHPA